MSSASALSHARVVLPRFAVGGPCAALAPHGHGHIHDSFVATVDTSEGARRYLLQRLNATVFPDPEAVVANIAAVTAHLRRRRDDERAVLSLVPTHAGGWLERDEEGGTWRLYDFVEGSVARERAESPEDARTAARGFAAFLRDLAGGPPLAEILPHFHDTPRRLAALHTALHADAHHRARTARAEIAAVERAAPLASALTALHDRGAVPRRIVHNDTKINNLLLDERTGRELCVIDLDTVMPGLALYDFGDLVRTIASASPEDEPDAGRVAARPDFVLAAARGWIEGSAGTLLAAERERLVLAARVLSFECGVRFLTDYLHGDVYFKIRRPNQNLDRCRAQLALERSLDQQEDALQREIEDPNFADARSSA
jgi:hypothetical protein